MKNCNKCGKELKDDDQICAYCGTSADNDHDNSQILKNTDLLNSPTGYANNKKSRILTIILVTGIIILAVLLIFIIVFIWHGFIDASSFISFCQIQPPIN